MYTQLKDRVLWYDGTITVSSVDKLLQLLNKNIPKQQLFIDELTADVKQYNKLVLKSDQILQKKECILPQIEWNIPQNYKELDIKQFLIEKLEDCSVKCNYTEHETIQRLQRVTSELKVYQQKNLIGILKTIIFFINTLEENKIVWGVGRGSSVSSYILFLIGVHDVDSFKFNLQLKEFIA